MLSSWRPLFVYWNHIQLGRYCLDIGINRLSMDHDTWGWLLLLRFTQEEECSQYDLSQYDDRCYGLLPGPSRFMRF